MYAAKAFHRSQLYADGGGKVPLNRECAFVLTSHQGVIYGKHSAATSSVGSLPQTKECACLAGARNPKGI
jgi:hypothetical protein